MHKNIVMRKMHKDSNEKSAQKTVLRKVHKTVMKKVHKNSNEKRTHKQ